VKRSVVVSLERQARRPHPRSRCCRGWRSSNSYGMVRSGC